MRIVTVAVEGGSPDISGMLKCDQPLLASRCSGITAYGCCWRRIVKTLVGPSRLIIGNGSSRECTAGAAENHHQSEKEE